MFKTKLTCLGCPLHQIFGRLECESTFVLKEDFFLAEKCLKLSLLYSCLLQSIINFNSCLGFAINLDSLLFLRALHVSCFKSRTSGEMDEHSILFMLCDWTRLFGPTHKQPFESVVKDENTQSEQTQHKHKGGSQTH